MNTRVLIRVPGGGWGRGVEAERAQTFVEQPKQLGRHDGLDVRACAIAAASKFVDITS